MKISSIILSFALLMGAVAIVPKAEANAARAVYDRVLFDNQNVSTSTYLSIFSNTSQLVTAISVYNSSVNPVVIAQALSSTTINTGNEVDQMVIPPGGSALINSPVVAQLSTVFPMNINVGRRLAVKCFNSPCVNGELQINLFYK